MIHIPEEKWMYKWRVGKVIDVVRKYNARNCLDRRNLELLLYHFPWAAEWCRVKAGTQEQLFRDKTWMEQERKKNDDNCSM